MNRSIFIIEDEGLIALMLQRYLSSQNYNILGIAKEGLKAIDRIKELDPDLIILDVNIQGSINGVETFKIIRSFSKAPVIFLTGNSIDIITNNIECIGVPIFEKPVSLEDLKRSIEKIFLSK